MNKQNSENIKNESKTTGRKGLSAFHMALGGILLALCIAGVFMSSVVPGAEMTLLLVASAGIFVFCREAGAAGGFVLYAAACLLSLILVPDKLAVLPLALVFGLYPVLKYLLEKVFSVPAGLLRRAGDGAAKNRLLCLAVKTVYYAVVCAVALKLFEGLVVSSAARSVMPSLADWSDWALLAAGWLVFVAYDVILSSCGLYYEKRFASRLPGAGRADRGSKTPPAPPEFKLYHGDDPEQE